MMQKRIIVGWIYFLIGLTPIVTFLASQTLTPNYFFWFSNHTFLILGLAILFKSPFWVFAELCIGLIPESFWSIDFLFQLITHKPLLGITSYMFSSGSFVWIQTYSLQHLLFAPCALYALYLLGGPVKNAWIGSLIHDAFLSLAGYLHSFDLNINCAYHTCGIPLPWHMVTWPILMFVHIALVYTLTPIIWKKLGMRSKRLH